MRRQAVVSHSKLTIPTGGRAPLARPHLWERLDEDRRLGLVSAPAGYGKTATLAAWAVRSGRSVAWLSCDRFDAEPIRFMSCLLTSISLTWPGTADDALVLLEREGTTTYDAAMAAANALEAAGESGVIVVDDLHLAAPDPDLLTAFISALPPTVQFVAGTRSDPPASLARWRLAGQLLELRRDDLRFDQAETAAFIATHDLSLAEPELAQVHDLTEGWPAGIQLATIALQRHGERDDFLTAFGRSERSTGDFLLSEVLAHLPQPTVELLLETSVLDELDADLCVDVTGTEAAAGLLADLVANDLFVVPLDDRVGRYRYHHLFGSFLQARLAAAGPTRVRDAHDRAGRALEGRGDIIGALEHALAIGDAERSGDILFDAVTRSMSISEGAGAALQGVRLWLHHCGEAAVVSDPRRLVELLIGLITLGAAEEVPTWLERVRQAHSDADGPLRALVEGTWGEYRQHRGESLAAIRHLEATLDELGGRPAADGLLAVVSVALARAHLLADDPAAATRVIDHAMEQPVGSPIVDDVRHPGVAAFAAARAGLLSRVDKLASQAEQGADALELGGHEPGRVYAGLARVLAHVERVEDEAALHLLDEVRQQADASNRPAIQATVALHGARVARALGNEAAAAAQLELAGLLLPAQDDAVRHVLAAEAAAQALRFDPGAAGPAVEALDDELLVTALLRARLALLDGDPGRAREQLAGAAQPSTTGEAVELGVLRAVSLLDIDVDQSVDRLRSALALAEPEGLVRTVVGAAPDVHRALRAFTPTKAHQAYVDELIAVAGRTVGPVRRRASPTTLVEPLSGRELTVLRYLCSRLTYQEIASALYVSLNTLKSHVRSVYRKLGVASRDEAVEQGREHGLI